MIDLEISLVKAVNWSLRDIELTDTESLLLFMHRLTATSGKAAGSRVKRQFIDQASGWL